jgi:hypothetical protein
MDPQISYLALLSLPVIFLLGWRCYPLIFLRQHLFYPYLIPQILFFGPLTRFHVILQIGYIGGTIAFNKVGVHSATLASTRACTIILSNLLFLFFSMSLEFAAKILNFSVRDFRQLHRTIGCMVYAQAVLHSSIMLSRVPSTTFHSQPMIYGIIVCQSPINISSLTIF